MLDLLVKNGTVIDGTGSPGFMADIAVKNERITKIAPGIIEPAERIIDASGLVVTPGFIDTHSHYDFIVLLPSDCGLLLEQGVTTQLAGNCGDSPAPYPASIMDPQIPAYLTQEQVSRLKDICRSPAVFMEHAGKLSYGVNTALLIGHNSIRLNTVGHGDTSPTQTQMTAMKELIREAMESGMFGYSSGLAYAPSCYAETEELIELARVAAEYGGIYATHIRGEGNHVCRAVAEAIEIGERSGARVLISHIKVMGAQNKDKAKDVLNLIGEARARGLNVFADQYPYESASAPLFSQLPPEYLSGGRENTLRLIADPRKRKEIEQAVFHSGKAFESCLSFAGYEGTSIVEAHKTPQFLGMTIAEAADLTHKTPFAFLMDLLIANDGEVRCVYKTMHPDSILTFLSSPFVFTGEDWAVLGNRPDPEKQGGGHPRGTAAFVRKLELALEQNILKPEECIYRMTGGPAGALGLPDRGVIREGYAADLCILDLDNLHAQADYRYPFRRNLGIRYVVVNGGVAVEDGCCCGKKFGRLLLRNEQYGKERI